MDENLIGYLLGALDEGTQQNVENHLRDNPDAHRKLDRLRRVLEPLSFDRDAIEPPAGLWMRTLSRIAEHRCRHLPHAPAPMPSQRSSYQRSRWRLPDVAVAAAILVAFSGLLLPLLSRWWQQHDIVACQNNLAEHYKALATFSDHHGSRFPAVETEQPVGRIMAIMHDANMVTPTMSMACPAANGRRAPLPMSVQELDELAARDPEQFQKTMRNMLGCYAYSLGYMEPGQDGVVRHYGLAPNFPDGMQPLMADRPPFDEGHQTLTGNSLNHGRWGQNVLFTGGQVKFLPSRFIGPDDIYLNRENKVGAGRDRDDRVLGCGWACP
jgi:hypothetical protein